MESIEKKIENYAVVFNVNLLRATLTEAAEFKDFLDETIHDSDKDIIVNLSACQHLDSTFLGVLVSVYKRLKNQNRTLVIIEPVDQSSIFLTLNSIGKIFPLYTSVQLALEDIENKKLLEKELMGLESEEINTHEKKTRVLHNNAEFLSVNSTEDSTKVETKHNEINLKKIPDVEEQLSIEPILEHKLPAEPDLALKVTDSRIENPASPFTVKSKEIISEQNTFQENSNELVAEETFATKRQNVKEDGKYSSGTVAWEFGFS